ncbi:hypothetical protein ADIS_4136 [Lunatimonas lonarensis]|uniref:Outer membrane protein beta-barrel domain-containing protein n=1 Tax=Lunatimonas lonarensis TaxID=1232681 RepID=R7ZMX5_9BACT|nr:hypothetical protein [Lunatimonas lonarensis]EON75432.1 hypothetical protein ADIS_4136 [Lunatimonas lonarensis]
MLLWKNSSLIVKCIALTLWISGIILFESKAQREIYPEDNPPLSERMYFGGNLSLQFGTITFIDVSPLAGVMVTEKYSAGVGATYQYFNDRFFNFSSNIYGGRIFNRYNVLPRIFAHAEYETLNVEVANRVPNTNDVVFTRDWVPGFLVGAGYFSPFGNRGGMNFMVLYNLLHDNIRSPYNEPYVIRVGFVF